MKNLYKLFTLTMGLLALSACEADRDSNPVLNEPDTFVLNVPAFALIALLFSWFSILSCTNLSRI